MKDSKIFDSVFNTKQKKLAFLQNLVLVAVADRNLDKQESEFLLDIGDQLGLSEEDTRLITENMSSLTFIVPEEGLQKSTELQALVMMMVQDGEIEESEYNLCLEYTRRIGFGKGILDDFIDQWRKK
ncbi:hypothetical protein GCM10023188_15010 [Pontibacter saemangeumensis]|uniref:Co-chaperone DjlA N-terminal domain-containing protein n=1 Tax=Pontibacter saemangeumensis TaxID=1084525 RepID=A0ABP8LHQ4_9BACT